MWPKKKKEKKIVLTEVELVSLEGGSPSSLSNSLPLIPLPSTETTGYKEYVLENPSWRPYDEKSKSLH